jgi:hypothetical protein
MDFTFKPSVLLFGDGLSTTTASVTVKVVWWTPGTVVDTTFSLVIYPTSKIVSWEYARTDSQPTVTKAGAVTNKTYLVGDPAVTITPPTFTAVATADHSSWGNTLIPVQTLYTVLEYSLDGSTWNLFPDNAGNVLLFSTNKDASCVTSVNSQTYAFTLYCTDNTKFAASGTGTYVVNLRYTAQWTKVYDQPSGAWQALTANTNAFTITINNKCSGDQITLGGLPGVSPYTVTNPVYSGAKMYMTAITFTHTDNTAPCNTYHTKLVEVSSDGTNWYSSGRTYTDLLASDNQDFAFILAPLTDVYDTGTADYTRRVRISVK